jgi:tRNA U54 and U55 pseudouridine synthase Pus10
LKNNSSLVAMTFVLWLAVMPGCKSNSEISNSQQLQQTNSQVQSREPSPAIDYSGFKARLDEGAGCAELFDIRNRLDPKSPFVVRINEELRAIGCYSSGSVRSSAASLAGKTKSGNVQNTQPVATFTVNEYKMYRAVINMPSSVSEQQALRNVLRQYKISAGELRRVINKVQKILFENKWFGIPESEIQHASDWKGEAP